MKKILYIFDVPTHVGGGAQKSMQLIVNNLKQYYQFYCITPNQEKCFDNQIILEQYNSFFNVKGIYTKLKLIYLIWKKIKKINPDIIHIQMPRSLTIIELLKRFNLIDNKIKLIFTDRHVMDKYDNKMKARIKRLSRSLECIVTTTDYNRKLYEQNKNINKPIITIPNTCGEQFEVYKESERMRLREKSLMSKNDIVIGFCGRISEDKDWPFAIELIKKLNDKINFKIIVCISTDNKEEKLIEAKEIIKKIEDVVGKERLVEYIDLKFEDMSNLYYMTDIFIVSSKVESFGRTAIEAMSRKNIVFARKVDGVAEVVKFEENLFSNTEEFIEKIEKVLKDEESIRSEKQKFYDRFNNNYKLEINLAEHKKLYDNIK